MLVYRTRSPRWLPWIYPNRVWHLPSTDRRIYLTFDDGPHPEITSFVLDQLDRYKARASFFCIGQNVDRHPSSFSSLQEAGQGIGNHTQHHLNGWKTPKDLYLRDVTEASGRIRSDWFRPPYGRLTSSQARSIRAAFPNMRIAMWDILSGDFDSSKTGEVCADQVLKYVRPGSIVVMHDSEKAWDRLRVCLPVILEKLSDRGFQFDKLPGS